MTDRNPLPTELGSVIKQCRVSVVKDGTPAAAAAVAAEKTKER